MLLAPFLFVCLSVSLNQGTGSPRGHRRRMANERINYSPSVSTPRCPPFQTQNVHLYLTRHHKSWCLCSNCVNIRTGNTQDYSESCVDSDFCQLLQTSASKGVHVGNAVPSIVRWTLSISTNAVLGPLPGTWANISDLWWAP